MYRVIVAAAAMALVCGAPAGAREAVKLGWVEKALILPGGVEMLAKLDSGAWTTSIHADDIELFQKDGKRWVRFKITGTNKTVSFERPIVRMAKIRRAGAQVHQRPVVELGICMGSFYRVAQVNLNSRDRMRYKLLIGRRYLKKGIILDSSKRLTTEPNCPNAAKPNPK